ncbi:MAG: hypothetical protein WC551_01440 [Patescibacteria group bacterium]
MAPISEESVQRPEGEVAAEKKKQPEKAEDVAVEMGPGGIEEFIEKTEEEAGKEFTEFSGPVAGPELAAQTSDQQVKLSRDLETAREKAKTEVKAVEQEASGAAAAGTAPTGEPQVSVVGEAPAASEMRTETVPPVVESAAESAEQATNKILAMADSVGFSAAELALDDPMELIKQKRTAAHDLLLAIDTAPDEVFDKFEDFKVTVLDYTKFLEEASYPGIKIKPDGSREYVPRKVDVANYQWAATKMNEALSKVRNVASPTSAEAPPAPAAETKPAEKPVEAPPVKAPEMPNLEPVAPVVPDLVVESPKPRVPEASALPAEPVLPPIPDLVTPEAAAAQAAEKKAEEESVDAGFDALHAEAMPQSAEAKAQARMAEILQEMDGLRLKIKENPANKQALLQRRQALALEGRGVQDSIKKLKQEALAAQNQAELDEIDAGFTEMHEEAMGAEAKQFEALKSARSELMSIAKDLEANGGKITDDMANRFKALRDKIDDLETAGAPAKNLQEMMHHFGMIMNPETSPDEAARLGGLKEFFNENPDEQEAPKAETEEETNARLAKEAEEAFEVRKKQEDLMKRQQEGPKLPALADIVGLVDLASSAPEVGEADFKSFFEEYNGAEYGIALKKLDGVMGQRDAKIKELLAVKPEGERHKKKIDEQIACLKLANQISAMRKEQWAKQNEAFKAQKAIDLISADIADTQEELVEVNSMLEDNPNDPNLLRTKARLEQQMEHQGNELVQHVNARDRLKEDLKGLDKEIKLGTTGLEGLKRDIDKPPEAEDIKPRPSGTPGMSPEEAFEKGMANLGFGVSKVAAGLTEWMSQDDIGEAAFGAVGKIFDALEWAVDKIPGGEKTGASAAKKKG